MDKLFIINELEIDQFESNVPVLDRSGEYDTVKLAEGEKSTIKENNRSSNPF